MTVAIRPAVLRDACFIAANMREADRAEISAVVDMREPAAVAALLLAQSGAMAFVAYIGRDPVCAFGVARLYEHVGAGWAFGTKRMRRVVPAGRDRTRVARSRSDDRERAKRLDR